VVIATRDRAGNLARVLDELRTLPEQPPVVVVDNGSTDGTTEMVRARYPDVSAIALESNRGAAARNAGVEALTTPYVAFCDDDSWWEPGSLGRAAALFDAHPSVGLIAGKVLVGSQESLELACVDMAESPLGRPAHLPGPRILGFVACGAIVRKDAFRAAGGFDERLGVGGEEDLVALSMAALGWDLVYVDQIVAHHHPSVARDKDARTQIVVRNHLWTVWLRRSPRTVVRATIDALRRSPTSAGVRKGVLQAVLGLPWILRHRVPLPPRVEAMARSLEE
jgi:GT2 family glycosyltransferase